MPLLGKVELRVPNFKNSGRLWTGHDTALWFTSAFRWRDPKYSSWPRALWGFLWRQITGRYAVHILKCARAVGFELESYPYTTITVPLEEHLRIVVSTGYPVVMLIRPRWSLTPYVVIVCEEAARGFYAWDSRLRVSHDREYPTGNTLLTTWTLQRFAGRSRLYKIKRMKGYE